MKLEELKKEIEETLGRPPIDRGLVVEACDCLSKKILLGELDGKIRKSGWDSLITEEKRREAARLLSREALEKKLETELGTDLGKGRLMPLGVLFHIGAGNMDGLPAYSAIEGLLAGNINLLKLPGTERGISRLLLDELIAVEPELKPYLYVVSIPSANIKAMKQLAALADGIAVWGGDEAVMAVRAMANPGTRLIEWGHKLSFAYVTIQGLKEEAALQELARHIVSTGQLLCSSCQGIFLDTTDGGRLNQFSRQFAEKLEKEAANAPAWDLGIQAQNTLRTRSRGLEAAVYGDMAVFGRPGFSVTRCFDSDLELSPMFGNCFVKPLPKERIIRQLRKQKHHLQTVGLLCGEEEFPGLSALFCRAGAVHVIKGGAMSKPDGYDAHDGEYPLRRYTKIVKLSYFEF